VAVELAVRGRRVVLPEGVREAAILVEDGRIRAVGRAADIPAGVETIDAGDRVVMPGIVDTHAHINEPGRTEWEGFETATRACAAGGITTVVDMPLNSIPATTTLAALERKRAAAEGQCRVDHGFWGGVVPGNAGELAAMARAGALGFKAFLIESGVDEFECSREQDLREAMPILARAGVPLLVHAELDLGAPAGPGAGDARRYSTYLGSRPRRWEDEAVRLVIRLARQTGCRAHVVHLSSADALVEIARAKGEGVPLTVETCPHYLSLAAEEIADGATHFKCAPPIRERENRERLWKGLADGVIDFVVSDHSPCTPALKRLEEGDFGRAWGGISSLQLSLPVIWTGARARGHGVERLAHWMCEATSRFAGLDRAKGALRAGLDADLVLWDPERRFTVDPKAIHHRHALTPYAGQELFGVVDLTLLRGQKVFEKGHFPGPPRGRALKGRE
jgi:allantoinase